jgi:hypothetical protein
MEPPVPITARATAGDGNDGIDPSQGFIRQVECPDSFGLNLQIGREPPGTRLAQAGRKSLAFGSIPRDNEYPVAQLSEAVRARGGYAR